MAVLIKGRLRVRSHRGRTAIQEARSRRWCIPRHEIVLEAECKSNTGFIVLESLEEDARGILTTRARTSKRNTFGKNQPKTRKEIQKAKYSFLRSSVGTSLYADYFNPDIEVEWRIMGLSANVRISFFMNKWILHLLWGNVVKDVRSIMCHTPTLLGYYLFFSLLLIFAESIPARSTLALDDFYRSTSRTILTSTLLAQPPCDTNSQTQDETQFVLPSAHISKRQALNLSETRPKKKVKISVGPVVDLQD